ncbi:hypothetical protein BGZ61DRAFT_227247 [Ilyonectria robusta]|uniref:uncharacterized protein n=1 Tax=Ilyonectria robusta TaxID=1079257 RepID=UPI001E8EA8FF|nr:uncharacterized protein BGZ61DRAFT_227247 [Ilyonectria robusta]KAH8706790.1 hypothetical protein BGZ61DRAFT_227247 [Ilyonectria robusta]
MWSLPSQVTVSGRSSAIDERTPSPAPSLIHGSSPTNSELEQRTPSPILSGLVRPELKGSETELYGWSAPLHRPSVKQSDVLPVPTSWSPVESRPNEVATNACDQRASVRVSNTGPSEFIMISCFNIQRAQWFYSQCFEWTFLGDINRPDSSDEALMRHGSSPYDALPMNFFTSDASTNSHNVTGALLQRNDPPPTQHEAQARALQGRAIAATYFRVPDIGDTADRIEANLGVVRSLRFGIRGMMDIGEFMDPEGNLFGLVSYHPENIGI